VSAFITSSVWKGSSAIELYSGNTLVPLPGRPAVCAATATPVVRAVMSRKRRKGRKRESDGMDFSFG